MSSLFSTTSDFFGLDIGSTAVRLVELRGGGTPKALVKYAYVPLESTLALSDSKADQQKLAQAISQLVSQAHVATNNVAVGIPSSRVFTTVADVDRLSAASWLKLSRSRPTLWSRRRWPNQKLTGRCSATRRSIRPSRKFC